MKDSIMEVLEQFGGQNLYIREVRENVTNALIDVIKENIEEKVVRKETKSSDNPSDTTEVQSELKEKTITKDKPFFGGNKDTDIKKSPSQR